ncbi:unnamed protein product [Oppiella nova]|uniref:Uncharacterized protein n=1 Tax=Oppiella nova TaxID=334625 RepID=A0A7R9QTM3_9ACAR|nr:unnamed protein product [Oppiella nova]CAG2174459.1 unnamed protein product [Oppiella nova]
MSEEVLTENITISVSNGTANNTLAWANEWLGYLALGMFSMVLFIPTLGIIGLMVWEYFSDEAERKAERQKEIEQVMRERYFGIKRDKDEDNDDMDEGEDEEDDEEEEEEEDTPAETETLIHKRRPKMTKAEDFDCL